MGFSALRDILSGVFGADQCVKSVLSLMSPENVGKYLVDIHEIMFPKGNSAKEQKWLACRTFENVPEVFPIMEMDLSDPKFMRNHSRRLSFDVSRFIEFLNGYNRVDDDLKPIMLHYSMIYLLDFFSRTWLKYTRNKGHCITMMMLTSENIYEQRVKIEKSGVFPRAVDAFYFLNQSSIFSVDDDDGISLQHQKLEVPIEKIEKKRYAQSPQIALGYLIDTYERVCKMGELVKKSNPILLGYLILFIESSLSRYRAEDWFKIRENRDLESKFNLVQYDALYHWTHEILMQTILKIIR